MTEDQNTSPAAANYDQLAAAIQRPRTQRSPEDFGAWDFAIALDEDQLAEFRNDVAEALQDDDPEQAVSVILKEWRATAEFMADDEAVRALDGLDGFDVDDEDAPSFE